MRWIFAYEFEEFLEDLPDENIEVFVEVVAFAAILASLAYELTETPVLAVLSHVDQDAVYFLKPIPHLIKSKPGHTMLLPISI